MLTQVLVALSVPSVYTGPEETISISILLPQTEFVKLFKNFSFSLQPGVCLWFWFDHLFLYSKHIFLFLILANIFFNIRKYIFTLCF